MRAVPDQAWKTLTSTVGLVAVRYDAGVGAEVNVMSAEWSYFVNKDPLYVAVVLSPRSRTRELLARETEFSLTLCAEEQAELADFAGSFSLDEIPKSTSELVDFGEPEATSTPWVTGGLLAVECRLRETIDLPVHKLFIGEAVAVHPSPVERRPLVKHGSSMYALGPRVRRAAVVVAAAVSEGVLRVSATGPAADEDEWRVRLMSATGSEMDLGAFPAAEYGDFQVDIALPLVDFDLAGARVRVDLPGAKPGYARLSTGAPQ